MVKLLFKPRMEVMLVTGDHDLTQAHHGPAEMLMIKMDSMGNVIWANTADNDIN